MRVTTTSIRKVAIGLAACALASAAAVPAARAIFFADPPGSETLSGISPEIWETIDAGSLTAMTRGN